MDTFSALSDPTRREILELLANSNGLSAMEIGAKFPMSAPAISQHLKVLREANLVNVEKRAQQRIYRMNPAGMFEFEAWVQRMHAQLSARFDRLDQILEAEKNKLNQGDETK